MIANTDTTHLFVVQKRPNKGPGFGPTDADFLKEAIWRVPISEIQIRTKNSLPLPLSIYLIFTSGISRHD